MTPDRINRLRRLLHLSKHEFALIMGTCVATITRWEAGRTAPNNLAKILLDALQQASDTHGEQRIRGIDWHELLKQQGLMKVIAAILNFATMPPDPPPEQPSEYVQPTGTESYDVDPEIQ